jgi:3-deoxy-7-phosphoheptulonate synthase
MLVRLRRNLTTDETALALALFRELGLEPRFLDSSRELVELQGPPRPEHRSRLEDCCAVAAVLDAGDSRELFGRIPGAPPTVVRAADAAFGGGSVSIVAGPCAIEDEPRALEIATEVRARGATLFRGGAFKPRSSPYSFQGAGRRALEILARVRVEVGIGIVTEALDPRDVAARSRTCSRSALVTWPTSRCCASWA